MEGNAIDRQVGDFGVEEPHQPAHQATFRLPFFAQVQHVVTGQQGDVDLGNDRVVVADDARVKFISGNQLAEEIFLDLLLDGT